ncbi:MAG TPA: PIN domain-containing protein [Polyangiaceae bacterium]|jgi:predicted nucleic acid-binding protein
MSDRVFVDTNVLVYAHDVDAGSKHAIAVSLVSDLWSSRAGALSLQVLQELYVNITRKIRTPVAKKTAREIVETYGAWHVQEVGPEDVVRASLLEERQKLSFWDALILVAAKKADAVKLLSEDMSHGQRVDGVLLENPFV